jgi:hypothetical protein
MLSSIYPEPNYIDLISTCNIKLLNTVLGVGSAGNGLTK